MHEVAHSHILLLNGAAPALVKERCAAQRLSAAVWSASCSKHELDARHTHAVVITPVSSAFVILHLGVYAVTSNPDVISGHAAFQGTLRMDASPAVAEQRFTMMIQWKWHPTVSVLLDEVAELVEVATNDDLAANWV